MATWAYRNCESEQLQGGDPRKDLGSRVAVNLLYNRRFSKQMNGYSFRKCMATPCIESMEGSYFGRTSDSKCCLHSKRKCLY